MNSNLIRGTTEEVVASPRKLQTIKLDNKNDRSLSSKESSPDQDNSSSFAHKV